MLRRSAIAAVCLGMLSPVAAQPASKDAAPAAPPAPSTPGTASPAPGSAAPNAAGAAADPTPPIPTEESNNASKAASDEAGEKSDEVIRMERRWPGVDLVDAEHTSRSTSVVRPSKARVVSTLGDHLEGSAGIAIQRTGPGQAVPIVRGLIGSAVLVLVDGIRLNNAIFRPAPNQYTSLVDPWRIETITVLKGPGSAPFGSDALGGVIEVTTELPRFDRADWSARHEATVGFSTADRSSVGHASFAAGKAGLGLSGSVTAEDHEDLRSGSGHRQEPSDYRAFGAQLTGHADHGKASTTAWLQYYEQPELPRTDELRPGFGQPEPAAEVWAYRPSRRVLAHLREVVRQVGPLDGLELHAAYQRVDDHRRIRDTGSTEELREEIVDHGFTAVARGAATAAGATLLGGLEGLHDRVDCARQTLDLATGMSEETACRFPDGSTMSQLGVFAEARRPFGAAAGAHLDARLGLRAGVSALRIAGDADTSADVTTSDWAAELGLELHLGPAVEKALGGPLSLVANLGRGFRAPNVNDLSGLGPRPGNRYQQPADSLANEHALGGDVGVRLRHPRVTAEGYAFALRHDDRIDVVPTGDMTDTGRQIVVSDNVGTTTTYGVELSAAAAVRDDLALVASLTWIRGDKDDRGEGEEPADRIPPLGGSVSARYTPVASLDLDGVVRFARAQRRLSVRDQEDPRIDPTGTDAFTTFSVGARYAWPQLAVSARVENLTDLQYREHASGIDAPGIDGRLMVHWTRDY